MVRDGYGQLLYGCIQLVQSYIWPYIYIPSPFLRVLGVLISEPFTDIVSEAMVSARLTSSPSVWNNKSYTFNPYILTIIKYFATYDYRGSTSQGLWWRDDKRSCWDFSMEECILDGWVSLVTYTGDKWIYLKCGLIWDKILRDRDRACQHFVRSDNIHNPIQMWSVSKTIFLSFNIFHLKEERKILGLALILINWSDLVYLSI